MNRTLSLSLAAVLCAAALAQPSAARAQTSGTTPSAYDPSADNAPALGAAEQELVRSSRAAIIAAGFSEPFVERHFTPVRVVNSAGDRRVVWRFSAFGHETFVNDSVGTYTDAQGRRHNTHSVASVLAGARDIRPAISRRRAERIMRACIGQFEGGAVVFQQFGARPRPALVFTAATPPPPEASVAQPQFPQESGGDEDRLKRGGKKGPPLLLGTVNLETGRCVRGRAQTGSPQPGPAGPRRN